MRIDDYEEREFKEELQKRRNRILFLSKEKFEYEYAKAKAELFTALVILPVLGVIMDFIESTDSGKQIWESILNVYTKIKVFYFNKGFDFDGIVSFLSIMILFVIFLSLIRFFQIKILDIMIYKDVKNKYYK